MVEKKTIVFGISGGIAGYKTPDLIKYFKKSGFEVRVILTKTASRMFEKDLFGKACGHTPKSEMVPVGFNFRDVLKKEQVEHIRYSDIASAVIIAPATANIIGKIVNGIADDLLTTVVMATTAPVIICPSMNVHMWENPIVAENIKKLINNGYIIIPPEKGRLACGYEGVGRLADLNSIYETVISIINRRNRLKGKRILITAGGTSEPIDAVRVISNKGSGKMGTAIAQECAKE
jgi:phosphopantothenoylcysteine decarboxylase/phosphopantothenate--cysteine ligase